MNTPSRPVSTIAAKIAQARANRSSFGTTFSSANPAAAALPTGQLPATLTPAVANLAAPPPAVASARRAQAPAPQPQAASGAGARVHISGAIVKVLFGDAQSSKAMLLLRTSDGTIKVQGALAFEPAIGLRVSAAAVKEKHPQYGDQYNADIIFEEIPLDRAGATIYLARVLEGVGKATANKLYDHFGQSVYEVIQNQPTRLLGVGGITEAKLQRIVASWEEDSAVRNIATLLGRHGVGGAIAARVYGRFGSRAMKVAKDQPYLLTAIDGVGFLTADRIALGNGLAPDAIERLSAAIEFTVARAAQYGHSAKPLSEVIEETLELTKLQNADATARIQAGLKASLASGRIVTRTLNDVPCISSATLSESEHSIADEIHRLAIAGGASAELSERAQIHASSLNDNDQAAAVSNVFESPVSVITGRPGCGKTTVVRVIHAVAKESGLDLVMAAPTGKAARRLIEATGQPAETVHSLLRPEQGTLSDFQHDRNNPLRGDVFVIDECSMMDTLLMRAYLQAIPSGARVVLVGDSDQLPSVGAGNVLRDIIASQQVPVARLHTIHRTALGSDIVVNAHRIINGEANKVDLRGGKDFRFIAAIEEATIQHAVIERYRSLVSQYSLDGVQVLCARHGTEVGVEALNALLRAVANPPSFSKPELDYRGRLFRLGDRVMRMSNSKDLSVSNGEVGVISQVDTEGKAVTVRFGDRTGRHEGKEVAALQLAYATTIHKSQGSEYSGVIVVVPASHKFMLNRNLLYTAITRGKKEATIVGEQAVFRHAVARPGAKRCTGLSEEIRKVFLADQPNSANTLQVRWLEVKNGSDHRPVYKENAKSDTHTRPKSWLPLP